MTYFIVYTALVLLTELVYFKIAARFEIVDKPNARSSHSHPIIRGGGIIFIVGIWLWFGSSWQWPFFVLGATGTALISFLDDLKPLPAILRLTAHLISVLLLFYQVELFDWSIWLLVVAVIVCIGTMSAYNFMDGINGITGVNALVYLGTCFYINFYNQEFTDWKLLTSLAIAVIIFLYFNFRRTAKCFAGDVGSIVLAFAQIFFLLQLIQKTNSLLWAGMFFVFGVDSVFTIIFRIRKKENIFKAHRTHLYQFLSNELKLDHRVVSALYGGVQLMINICLIAFSGSQKSIILFGLGGVMVVIYLGSRQAVLTKINTRSL